MVLIKVLDEEYLFDANINPTMARDISNILESKGFLIALDGDLIATRKKGGDWEYLRRE